MAFIDKMSLQLSFVFAIDCERKSEIVVSNYYDNYDNTDKTIKSDPHVTKSLHDFYRWTNWLPKLVIRLYKTNCIVFIC